MPLDIQIPYKGSDYLFQGISSGASGLASGAEAAIKKYKQIQDAGKAADYFMKAGGDEMYQQAGMHPEEFKTLGARDKAAVVQGIMEQGTAKKLQAQMQDMQAQAEERRQMGLARQQQMQLQQEEAEGMPRLAEAIMAGRAAQGGGTDPTADPGGEMPTGAGGGAPPRTGNFSPEEIMAGIQSMGKTNPKLAATLSRTLIPKLMNPENGGPQSWTSPTGHPYVWMNKTLMPDRDQFDPSQMMGSVPAGYEAVQTGKDHMSLVKTQKELPASFHSTMDKIQEDIAGAQGTLERPDAGFTDAKGAPMKADQVKTMRQFATNRLKAAQTRGKATIDRYHTGGFITPEQRDDYYTQLGLDAATTPAAAAPAGKAPKAGEVRGGYKFKGGNPADKANWEKVK